MGKQMGRHTRHSLEVILSNECRSGFISTADIAFKMGESNILNNRKLSKKIKYYITTVTLLH